MREMYGHLKLLAALRERQVGPEPEAHNFGKRVECVGENIGDRPQWNGVSIYVHMFIV